MTQPQSFGPVGTPIRVTSDEPARAGDLGDGCTFEHSPGSNPECVMAPAAPVEVVGATRSPDPNTIEVFDGEQWVDYSGDPVVVALYNRLVTEQSKVRRAAALIDPWEDAAAGERPQERTRQMLLAAIAELRGALDL